MISQPVFKQQKYLRTVLLIFAWFTVNIWTFNWFFESLKYTSPVALTILSIATTALIAQLWHKGFWKLESLLPRFSLYPVLLMLGGEIGAIACKWLLNMPQLTLACFILGSYGLLGLFLSEAKWHQGLSIATVAACVIPFSLAFNSGLGFPVRVLTAHAVAHTLANFHLSAVSSHDIIVMENGIAQVDLPCSGMKSLWTGTVFLLGVTWLESRRLGFRWLIVAIANILFLVVANVVRVFTLVVIIEVWQQQQIAEVLHLPLGVIGFIFASVLTWLLLQKVPCHDPRSNQGLNQHLTRTVTVTKNKVAEPKIKSKNELKAKSKVSNLNWLLVIVIALGIVGQFEPFSPQAIALEPISLPATIATEKLELTTAEVNFFDNPANPLVQKVSFKANEVAGSMLIVASDTWQAHHPPELCFLGNGFRIDKMESKLISDSINARWLSLQNGNLSAAYWFQSPQSTTDDFIARIWDHLAQHRQTWVLVSVLFDQPERFDSQEINDFTQAIYQTVNQNLNS